MPALCHFDYFVYIHTFVYPLLPRNKKMDFLSKGQKYSPRVFSIERDRFVRTMRISCGEEERSPFKL